MVKAVLYDYQRAAAEFVKKTPRSALFLDIGLGKAVDDDAIIPTPAGYRRLGDIQVGDMLFDRKGRPTEVKDLYKHKNKDAYKVSLEDGRSFIACDEHLIPYHSVNSEDILTKTLGEMLRDYRYISPSGHTQYKYSIPHNEAVEYPEQTHSVSPYDYGKQLGGRHIDNISESYMLDSTSNRKKFLNGVNDGAGIMTEHVRMQLKDMARSLGLHTADKNHIVKIESVAPRNMTCFTVDNDESLFLINDYIVTHNTLVTLTALTELAAEGQLHGHILIISPKRISINTWPDEIEKWDHTRGARFVQLAGLTKKKRDALLDEVETDKPSIYLINRELVPKLVDRFPGKKWPFMNVVIDEAQSFKGYGSVGFKSLKSIAEYTHRWIELTGSPSPNGLLDIWSLIYLLDGGHRLGKNITAYRNQHFLPGRRTPEGYPYEWLLIDGHDQLIHNKIKDVAISMMKSDYLDMAGITHNYVELEMTKAERKVYNQLKKDMILPLLDGGEIEAANAAVLYGKLMQLSNGAIFADDERNEIIELHDHKIEALKEIVDGSNGQPILCFYWYKHDIARLRKAFPDAEVFGEDPNQLKRWNNKEIPLLFVHPASAGHGLNFQYGGHIIVYFVIPTSLELYEQSIGRLYRNGQDEHVIVHYLKMRGTVEDKVIQALVEKSNVQKALIDAVKADITNI